MQAEPQQAESQQAEPHAEPITEIGFDKDFHELYTLGDGRSRPLCNKILKFRFWGFGAFHRIMIIQQQDLT